MPFRFGAIRQGGEDFYSNEPLLVTCMLIYGGTNIPKTDATILLLPMTVKCTFLSWLLQHGIDYPIRYLQWFHTPEIRGKVILTSPFFLVNCIEYCTYHQGYNQSYPAQFPCDYWIVLDLTIEKAWTFENDSHYVLHCYMVFLKFHWCILTVLHCPTCCKGFLMVSSRPPLHCISVQDFGFLPMPLTEPPSLCSCRSHHSHVASTGLCRVKRP